MLSGIWNILTKPFVRATHALVWCGEACLSNILGALSVSGLIDCGFVWFNNTTCSGKLYRPTGQKLLKAKQFTFLIKDQILFFFFYNFLG